MGTCIEAAATRSARGLRFVHAGRFARGALRLSEGAAKDALAHAHREARELDVLINAGLYKDHHLAEPALASLVQDDIHANPHAHDGARGTFSFDVMNGGCGVLTAAQLIDGLVSGGTAKVGLVVAGDADPEPLRSRGFRFAAAGGAFVLARRDGPVGFTHFAFRTFPDDADLFEARVGWQPSGMLALTEGRNVLAIRQDARYVSRCVAHAIEVARELLERAALTPDAIDLLIASQVPGRFAHDVAMGLGLRPRTVPELPRALSSAHTAGPIAALEAAIDSGAFAAARHVLFVTAGAGIAIGAALYQGRA